MLSKRISGIYKITNLFNGSFYIGSSFNIEKRFKRHWWELKNNKHTNSHLQRSANKYGLENFTFEIIDYCEDTNLLELEQFYIDTLQPDYNICKIAGSQLGVMRSEEFKQKLKNVNIGKILSEETKLKISVSNKGKYVSDKTRNKISQIHKGKILSDEIKMKISLGSFGKKLTEEHKQRISENHYMLGKLGSDCPNSKKIIQLKKDGEVVNEFGAISEASRETSINLSNIQSCCAGNRKSAGGFIWKYVI